MRNVCHMEPNPVGPWLAVGLCGRKAGSRSRDELAHFACAVNGGRGVTDPPRHERGHSLLALHLPAELPLGTEVVHARGPALEDTLTSR